MFTTSPNGLLCLEDSESVVLKAYRDIGGVLTIGMGLTELSKSFRRIWRAEHGGKPLKLGDTVTLGDARRYAKMVLAEEFEPATRLHLVPKEQHVFDGGVSVLWNCGTGAGKWKWGQAVKAASAYATDAAEYASNIARGCKRLLTTAITAAGRPVRGLETRRAREARLIQYGDYGRGATRKGNLPSTAATAISTAPEAIKVYQKQLAALGLYTGVIDGKAGKGSLTDGAVRNFQRSNGLKVDGVVGPATRAALVTAVRAKTQTIGTFGGAGVGTGGAGLGFEVDGAMLLTVAGVLVVVLLVGFAVWNNRGRILGVRTPA